MPLLRPIARPGVLAVLSMLSVLTALSASAAELPPRPTLSDVIKASTPADWRALDPANTLYMELPGGRVVIELAPVFAPLHVANIKQLVTEKFFDGLAVVRVQDNFVAQWGDAEKVRHTETALRKIRDETIVAWGKGLPLLKLPDPDGY